MSKNTHFITQELYDAIEELLNDGCIDSNYIEINSFSDSHTKQVFNFITILY